MRHLIIAITLTLAAGAASAESGVAYWTGQMKRSAGNLVACQYDAPTFTFWITVEGFCPLTIRV